LVAWFSLVGDVSSNDLAAIRPVLAEMVRRAAVTETGDGLHVVGVMDGADAREVNRRLLSALRRVEKRTRLRAEWTGSGHIYRFFDYVPKSTRPAARAGHGGGQPHQLRRNPNALSCMPRVGRQPGSVGKVTLTALASWDVTSKPSSRRFPVTVTQLPVTRCQICRRTVAYRPGRVSEVLTEHCCCAHPEALGIPSR
jgi:hypothetical protein